MLERMDASRRDSHRPIAELSVTQSLLQEVCRTWPGKNARPVLGIACSRLREALSRMVERQRPSTKKQIAQQVGISCVHSSAPSFNSPIISQFISGLAEISMGKKAYNKKTLAKP